MTDLTTGAAPGNGKPVYPGDIIRFEYTITNNSDTDIWPVSISSTLNHLNCGANIPCEYGPGKIWDSTAEQYGFLTYPFLFDGAPDPVNAGHLKGDANHMEIVGDLPRQLPQGATARMSVDFQMPLNAPPGTGLGMSYFAFSRETDGVDLAMTDLISVVADAAPIPTPTATPTPASSAAPPPVDPSPTVTPAPVSTDTSTPAIGPAKAGPTTPVADAEEASGALPDTGSAFPLSTLITGGVLLVAGVLMLVSRRRPSPQ